MFSSVNPMKKLFFLLTGVVAFSLIAEIRAIPPVRIFDGKTFAGWEGDTNKTFRIEDGAIIGGSLKQNVPHNEFLCTTRSFTNFIARLKFKLIGDPATGYQADMGEGWWGCLYDESRRNKVLVKPDQAVIEKALKRNEWNDYEIRCEGKRIQIILNGARTIDYTEEDPTVPGFGIIGLQIHGGGKAEAAYKDISIEELP
jgi:hypothetical protein